MKENIYNGKNTVFLHFFIMMYFNVYKVVVQSKGVFRGGGWNILVIGVSDILFITLNTLF